MVPLFLCVENLNEAELKFKGLICLAERISRQPIIQTMAWLLLIFLFQIYTDREQIYKNVTSGEKKKIKTFKVVDRV